MSTNGLEIVQECAEGCNFQSGAAYLKYASHDFKIDIVAKYFAT